MVIGALARIIALRMQAPILVIAVPAMMFMLPGLIIFRGMYQIALGSSSEMMNAGLHQLFTALIIILAIAGGIALGDVLMRPVTSRMRQTRYVVDRRDQMEELASAAAGSS
ncbi:threonine/serine exporter family protein [Nesterenkonia pannonica]|uniref:threonine/serine exporter family protein n=1 Tax=Nesterenkonia pannonica TaxID=1548602 RepID=UPI002164476D|nr:threonine/serine exporter family protein [Nesterenkonia pannonica]